MPYFTCHGLPSPCLPQGVERISLHRYGPAMRVSCSLQHLTKSKVKARTWEGLARRLIIRIDAAHTSPKTYLKIAERTNCVVFTNWSLLNHFSHVDYPKERVHGGCRTNGLAYPWCGMLALFLTPQSEERSGYRGSLRVRSIMNLEA